jgi:hypothetical protein
MRWRHIGGVEVQLHTFLTSALDGGEWPASHPSCFTPRERAPGTHWIEGWVGPRASLGTMVNVKIASPAKTQTPDHIECNFRCVKELNTIY